VRFNVQDTEKYAIAHEFDTTNLNKTPKKRGAEFPVATCSKTKHQLLKSTKLELDIFQSYLLYWKSDLS